MQMMTVIKAIVRKISGYFQVFYILSITQNLISRVRNLLITIYIITFKGVS
jgi:hypothetical protein